MTAFLVFFAQQSVRTPTKRYPSRVDWYNLQFKCARNLILAIFYRWLNIRLARTILNMEIIINH